MAQIQLHQGNYVSAQQSLEVGLSYNFEVRDHPLYHLVTIQSIFSMGTFSLFPNFVDSNPDHLVSEVTALPTVPTAMPSENNFYSVEQAVESIMASWVQILLLLKLNHINHWSGRSQTLEFG